MKRLKAISAALLVSLSTMLASGSTLAAQEFDQIGSFTETFEFMGGVGQFSVIDSDPDTASGERADFATIFDNFTLPATTPAARFNWIGFYDSLDVAMGTNIGLSNDTGPGGSPITENVSNFQVNIHSNATSYFDEFGTLISADNPGAVIGTANSADAGESLLSMAGTDIMDPLFGLYEYSATVNTPLTGGVKYWFSVTGELNAELNEWLVAFSDINGDGISPPISYNDLGDEADFSDAARLADGVNYAFSVTAVPEPTATVALIAVSLGMMSRRRRIK